MALQTQRWSAAITLLVIAAIDVHAQSYPAIPRWGQASAIIYDTLFIYGGKTDTSHQFTYSSAPNSNDLFSLDLTTSFSLSSPPWTYLSGSQNTSTSQGPTVAFHTLTPYTSTDFLLFGGDAGFGPIETNADSAWLLSTHDRLSPTWTSQSPGWASEPIRRVYHAAPSASGAIYILGGQKADHSQIGFPDCYLFNAVVNSGAPAFISLSLSNNAPPGLFGHAAHVLPGGLLLAFGGFSSSSNAPSLMSVIYILDTTSSSPSWSIVNATGTVPTPRRGFASVLLDNGKILIHGGADAVLQTVYSDAALLDTTQNPMTWSSVSGLSDVLGTRVGHFAAPVQGKVIFGFGWAGNAPASADIALYDPASNTFQSSYAPASAPISISTLPVSPTAPGGTYPTAGGGGGSPTPTGGNSNPTAGSGHGQGGNGNGNGQGESDGNGGGQGNGGGGEDGDQSAPKRTVAGIVVGSVFGFLAFVALAGGGAYYALRRRERRAWMGIDANTKKDVEGRWRLMPDHEPWDAADESPIQHPGEKGLQMAGTGWQGQRRGWGLLSLGAFVSSSDGNKSRHRRDMLADEDARQFDVDVAFNEEDGGWGRIDRYGNPRPTMRREGTGGSSMSFAANAFETGVSAWSKVMNASVTSLHNVGAALGVTATGAAAAYQGKGEHVNPPEWWEKDVLPLDPFSDAPGTGPEPIAEEMKAAMRPRGGQYPSSSEASNPYVDPFSDSEEVGRGGRDEGTMSLLGNLHDEGTASTLNDAATESMRGSLPRSTAMASLTRIGTTSPGPSELVGVISDASSARTMNSNSHAGSNPGTSQTSHTDSNDHSSGVSSPTSPRTTSIIGAVAAPSAPMRRSDSWWTRFSRTSFRDRAALHDPAHHTRHSGELIDFRDPNPAPRLGAIEEQSAQSSPQTAQDVSPKSNPTPTRRRKSGSEYAPSTKSSIKTQHTADSELIERVGGRMEVVQRALSLNSRRTASPATTFESPDSAKWGLSPIETSGSDDSHRRSWTGTSAETESFIAESPTENISHHSGGTFGKPPNRAGADTASTQSSASAPRSTTSKTKPAPPLAGPRPPRRALTGAVAARVSAYERRMSQDVLSHDGPRSPPADTKARQQDRDEERKRRGSVGYGLVPKAPLFVANPDHRKPSGST